MLHDDGQQIGCQKCGSVVFIKLIRSNNTLEKKPKQPSPIYSTTREGFQDYDQVWYRWTTWNIYKWAAEDNFSRFYHLKEGIITRSGRAMYHESHPVRVNNNKLGQTVVTTVEECFLRHKEEGGPSSRRPFRLLLRLEPRVNPSVEYTRSARVLS